MQLTPITPKEEVASSADMTPLRIVTPSAVRDTQYRLAMLSLPSEAFRNFFNGRTPTLQEKILFIEGAIRKQDAAAIYENNIYRVEVTFRPPFTVLSIIRHDGKPCKEWSHFQQIKNELVGPECEAVELYPAESRLVDAGNEYHLWTYPNPNERFPLGFRKRFVLSPQERQGLNYPAYPLSAAVGGAGEKQRPHFAAPAAAAGPLS